jgi:hypothetical protein
LREGKINLGAFIASKEYSLQIQNIHSVIFIRLSTDGGAQSIATIPLDTFTASGAAVVVGMFAQWGLTQLMFGLMYLIVLWRFQSLIPLMWLFIFFEWTGRLLVGLAKPMETMGTAPGAIGNLIFPVFAMIMLVLSLKTKKEA